MGLKYLDCTVKNKEGFGQRLIDKPLRERKKLLSMIFKPTQGVFELAPIQKATSSKDLQEYLKSVTFTFLALAAKPWSLLIPSSPAGTFWKQGEQTQIYIQTGRLLTLSSYRGEGMCVKNPESLYILGGRQDTW